MTGVSNPAKSYIACHIDITDSFLFMAGCSLSDRYADRSTQPSHNLGAANTGKEGGCSTQPIDEKLDKGFQ
jgi:hypothetical protein